MADTFPNRDDAKYEGLAAKYGFRLAPTGDTVLAVSELRLLEEFLVEVLAAPTSEAALLAFQVGAFLQKHDGWPGYAKPLYQASYEAQTRLQVQLQVRLHKALQLHQLGLLYAQLGQPASGFRAILLAYLEDCLTGGSKDDARGGMAYRVLRTRYDMRPEHFDQLWRSIEQILATDPIKDPRVELAKLHPEVLFVLVWPGCRHVPPIATEAVENVNWVLMDELTNRVGKGTGADWRFAELWLAVYLLSAPCFEVRSNIWTRTREYEFDVLASSGLNHLQLANCLGSYFAGEAKNWDETVGVPAVNHFAAKLLFHDMRFGVLLAKSGLSGDDKASYAIGRKTLLKTAHSHGLLIAVWTLKHLRHLCEERIGPLAALRLAYERERFELAE